MENLLTNINVSDIGLVGGFVAVIYILYKAGLLQAWAKKITGNGAEYRIKNLEGFRNLMETNHLHDLDDLKSGQKEVWGALNTLSKQINEIDKRLVRVETRMEK